MSHRKRVDREVYEISMESMIEVNDRSVLCTIECDCLNFKLAAVGAFVIFIESGSRRKREIIVKKYTTKINELLYIYVYN